MRVNVFQPDGSVQAGCLTTRTRDLLAKAVEKAVAFRATNLQPEHIFLVCCSAAFPQARNLVKSALTSGSTENLETALQTLLCDDQSLPIPAINLDRASMSQTCRSVFADLESWLKTTGSARIEPERLLSSALRHLEEDTLALMSKVLDIQALRQSLDHLLQAETTEVLIFDSSSRALRLDLFNRPAQEALRLAGKSARATGHDKITPAHILIGLFKLEGGFAEEAYRMFVPPSVHAQQPAVVLENAIRGPNPAQQTVSLDEAGFVAAAVEVVTQAVRLAHLDNLENTNEACLLRSLLLHGDFRVKNLLSSPPFSFNLQELIHYIEQSARAAQRAPFDSSLSIPFATDLTQKARDGRLTEVVGREAELENIKRTLFKKENNNIILQGERGVGKSSILDGLALDFLDNEREVFRHMHVLRVDCKKLAAGGERDIGKILEPARGRRNLILAFDDLDTLIAMAPPAGESMNPTRRLLWEALNEKKIQVVLTLRADTYAIHVETDPDFLKFFDVIRIEEMSKPQAVAVVTRRKAEIEQEYGVPVADSAVRKAVLLTHDYLISERLPEKAFAVVRACCDRLRYDAESGNKKVEVTDEAVIAEIARLTKLPAAMISGIGEVSSYVELLSQSIVGQQEAVQVVSDKLELIHAGMNDKNRPAAVLLFAGLTGTGKTELARTVASIYAKSRKLIAFHMEEFTQEFAESNLIGVPAGYKGHESGGPLINALNADPYSVLLFDEIEKAHPVVLKPLLRLFDTAEIEDRKNVKARGHRAFIILTSNVCWEVIDAGLKVNKPFDQIKDDFLRALSTARHPNTGQRYFPPEFLGRLDDLVLFKPLDEQAMVQVAQLMLDALAVEWQESREKTLHFAPEVAEFIGQLSYREDVSGPDRLCGRVVRKNIERMVKMELKNKVREIKNKKDVFISLAGNRVSVSAELQVDRL
ncbi:MAG: AAA family ATPase [bacterium]